MCFFTEVKKGYAAAEGKHNHQIISESINHPNIWLKGRSGYLYKDV
jgi:hypothetical protein